MPSRMGRWVHYDYMGLLASALTSLWTDHTLKDNRIAQNLILDSQGFYSNNWRADLASNRPVEATDQRVAPSQPSLQFLFTITPITPSIKEQWPATLQEDVVGIHTKSSPSIKKYRIYIGRFPDKKYLF